MVGGYRMNFTNGYSVFEGYEVNRLDDSEVGFLKFIFFSGMFIKVSLILLEKFDILVKIGVKYVFVVG